MSDERYEGLPEAVRRQAEQADQKIADMASQTPPAPPAEPPVAVPPANEPPAEPPSEGNTVTPPIPPEVAPPQPPREDWKQKFLTLQGKYNAEIPRLREEVTGLRALVAEQTHQLADALRQPPKTAEPPVDPNAPPKRRFVNDEDEAALGPELAAQQDKVLSRAIDPVQNELKATRATIDRMTKRLFFSDLTESVPQWREINKNQEFLDWLGEPDPMDPRRTRDDALKMAASRQDAEAAASIFGLFINAHPDVLKPRNGVPPQPAIPRREDLVQPPRQRGAPPPEPAKKTWKTSEIAQFAKEVSRKMWDSRPQEAARIQQEIDSALREGRVVKD